MEGKHPGPSDVAVLTLGSQDVAQNQFGGPLAKARAIFKATPKFATMALISLAMF